MSLSRLPGRLNPEETAWYLGFSAHDIPVLVSNRLLKPLGDPPPNGARYFAAAEVERLRMDLKWMDKASGVLIKHWKTKNQRKAEKQ